ncbi:MAG: FAD:protein FMN transferase [Bacteroidales bacterium]|nr:FAD:protein FMN transferase [Bacteroidales bacterium]
MKRAAVLLLFSVLLVACSSRNPVYHFTEGPIFGTSFHIHYEYKDGVKLDDDILQLMSEFNSSLSNYDPNSIISRFNQNDPTVLADDFFTTCFERAHVISVATNGAFDLTVAPLVNVWGFGFAKEDSVYPLLIDSLLEYTGYDKVLLKDKRLIKESPLIMLDASAIAKGFGVDVVSEYLESLGINNYLVEIGGELRCRGFNSRDSLWRVGVDKPLENMFEREFQEILTLTNISMATSGNYRQFYERDGVKYSHTIDPQTGYPVRHSLLSATVLAKDCMTADAYATAFMVMGFEKTCRFIEADSTLEALLIYSDEDGTLSTWASEGMTDKL